MMFDRKKSLVACASLLVACFQLASAGVPAEAKRALQPDAFITTYCKNLKTDKVRIDGNKLLFYPDPYVVKTALMGLGVVVLAGGAGCFLKDMPRGTFTGKAFFRNDYCQSNDQEIPLTNIFGINSVKKAQPNITFADAPGLSFFHKRLCWRRHRRNCWYDPHVLRCTKSLESSPSKITRIRSGRARPDR
ncbi:MAG: hypothetical protein WCT20_00255 [Candidatus Babeliales bacterium]